MMGKWVGSGWVVHGSRCAYRHSGSDGRPLVGRPFWLRRMGHVGFVGRRWGCDDRTFRVCYEDIN